MTSEQSFDQLLQACAELADWFPEGLVFIGGMAVYLHAINQEATRALAETTHDADLYISLADMADLRELEELTSNRRLGKHQLIKRGFDVDVYTERQSSLPVPYDQVMAHSQAHDVFKIACLEHLLVLKMAAYQDRKGSTKGEKDARDILRIAVVAQAAESPMDPALVLPYWTTTELQLLRLIEKGVAPLALSSGNAHEARRFRQSMKELVDALEAADHSNSPRPQRSRKTTP